MRSHPSRNPWPDGSAVHCPAHRSSPGSWRYFHTWVPWSAPRRTVRPAPPPWPAGTGHWLRQIRAEGGLRRSAETPVQGKNCCGGLADGRVLLCGPPTPGKSGFPHPAREATDIRSAAPGAAASPPVPAYRGRRHEG